MQAHIVQADGHVAPAARDHRRDVDRLVLSEAPELLVGSKPHLVALAVLRVVLQPLHVCTILPPYFLTNASAVMLDGMLICARARHVPPGAHAGAHKKDQHHPHSGGSVVEGLSCGGTQGMSRGRYFESCGCAGFRGRRHRPNSDLTRARPPS